MPEGPFGVPRPFSESTLELSYRILNPQHIPFGEEDIEFEDKVRRGFKEGSLNRTATDIRLVDMKEIATDRGHRPTAHISVKTGQIKAKESIDAGEEIAERIGGELLDVTIRCE